jgi:hypothetical protein
MQFINRNPETDARTTLDPLRVLSGIAAALNLTGGTPPRIVIDGSTPHIEMPDDTTLPNTIHLPAAPDFDCLDDTATRLRAYYVHEEMHHNYSQFPADVLDAARRDTFAGEILNGTDDARIDTAALTDFPGGGLAIRQAVRDDCGQFVAAGGSYGARKSALACAAKYVLERLIPADDARALFNDDGRKAFDRMRPYLDRLATMIRDGSALTDTDEFGRESIRAGVAGRGGNPDDDGQGDTPQDRDGNAAADDDDGESESGESSNATDGDDGQGETDPDGDDGDDDGETDTDGDDAAGGTSVGGENDGQGDATGGGASDAGGDVRLDTGDDFSPTDLAEKLRRAIGSPSPTTPGRIDIVDYTSHDVDRAPTGVRAVESGSARLAQEMRRAVKAPTRVIRSGKQYGDLDSMQFGRAVAGCRDVFQSVEIRPGESVAVSMLVDMSGSMMGREAAAVSDAAAAIAGACSVVGFAVEILGFDTGWQGVRISKLHEFGRRVDRDAVRRIRRYGRNAAGGTPTGEAMQYAAERLARRRESRRILIVLTDGQAYDPALARDIARRCKANRIEVVGVSVGYPNMARVVKDMVGGAVLDLGPSWNITPQSVMKKLESKLVAVIQRARI